MNKWIICIIIATSIVACKGKKEEEKKGQIFPVLSYLLAQVKNVDTSFYRIIKIETADSVSDTSFIRREEFRSYAKDFLDIPDISSAKHRDDYDESNNYDDLLNKALLTYTSRNSDNEIFRETVILDRDASGNSLVNTIIIDKQLKNKDSTVIKNMLWEANKRFQVITKTEVPNQPEKVRILQVVWNDLSNEVSSQ